MNTMLIELSEFESVQLMGLATAGRAVPLAFGVGGAALEVRKDGSADWAVEALAEIRKNSGTFIVTVKLPRNPEHDPRNKKTGSCPASPEGEPCTDVTGEHHSFLLRTTDLKAALERLGHPHITRTERVGS